MRPTRSTTRSGTGCLMDPSRRSTAYLAWIDGMAVSDDPRFFALCDPATGTPGGVMSYLRITPAAGSIEIGHICLSPALQRTPAATEAVFLMAAWAFDAGYRRFEWKCDALNIPSRRAAQRFGFSFEGDLPQAHGRQGPQPRQRLVRHDRRRLGLPAPRLSRPGSTRPTSTRTAQPEIPARRPDRPLPRRPRTPPCEGYRVEAGTAAGRTAGSARPTPRPAVAAPASTR